MIQKIYCAPYDQKFIWLATVGDVRTILRRQTERAYIPDLFMLIEVYQKNILFWF